MTDRTVRLWPRMGRPYIAASLMAMIALLWAVAVGLPAQAAVRNFAGIGVTADGQGYAPISTAGEVYAFGSVVYRGNPSGFSGSIKGISVTADGKGYAAISSAGQVYAYGTVQHRGNPTGFSGSIVGISVTADGQGYAAISSAGQVYAYGTVQHRGNPTGFTNGIVGVSVTANGQGYAAVSGYGQVYAYGTVRYWGNGDPGSSSIDGVRSKIVSTANSQVTDTSRNVEKGGSDCNFYTAALGAPGTACSNGWRARAWCADFARWTWGQAGADTSSDLNGLANSFKTYGTKRGTWHDGSALSGIQPGDVIGYNFNTSGTGDDHVNIVVSVSSTGTITAIGGNQSNGVTRWTFQQGAKTINNNQEAVSGYASPVI
jgi:CHAP domain